MLRLFCNSISIMVQEINALLVNRMTHPLFGQHVFHTHTYTYIYVETRRDRCKQECVRTLI